MQGPGPGDLVAAVAAGVPHHATDALLAALDAGGADPDSVGERLGLSERTLQRRLAQEGTTLRAIVAQQQYGRARDLLSDSALSIADVSARLGYGNPPAFTRAFRKWSGLTPAEYRGAMRAAG